MSKTHIKPGEGRVLRDHNRGYALVPAEGIKVVLDRVWKKRLKDGDAVVVEAKRLAPKPTEVKEDTPAKRVVNSKE